MASLLACLPLPAEADPIEAVVDNCVVSRISSEPRSIAYRETIVERTSTSKPGVGLSPGPMRNWSSALELHYSITTAMTQIGCLAGGKHDKRK